MKCSECDPKDFKKNGKRKDGDKKELIQRYKCKKCGKTYSEPKVTYTKTEKRLLSMLINFLENDLDELNVKEFLKKSKEYRSGISNIVIESPEETNPYGYRTEYKVKCRNPRLLICVNKNSIKLIKIPREVAKDCKKSFHFVVD